LAQNVKPASCWFDFFVFHACLVAGSKGQANTFFHFPWDGCDNCECETSIPKMPARISSCVL
ncbi:MAG: hypothetical protein ABSF38_09525, partial [Verrucomicrobiota bacterium]